VAASVLLTQHTYIQAVELLLQALEYFKHKLCSLGVVLCLVCW
jgi:hypothetical protein